MALAVKQAPFFLYLYPSPFFFAPVPVALLLGRRRTLYQTFFSLHTSTYKNNRNPTVKCYDRVAVAFCL